jgi:hypothetical protein
MVMSLVVSSSVPWLVGCHSNHCCCDRCDEVCAEEKKNLNIKLVVKQKKTSLQHFSSWN